VPLASASVDVVMAGYGLRNMPALEPALDEIARVLRPGGRFVALDFDRPASRLLRGAYLAYLWGAGSVVGWLLHGDADTYRYIPASLRRYPGARAVADALRARGFVQVEVVALLGGLMALHVAVRA
jgi:demethylmenaquinone methyltransferase/2-methoxy-6-polyprenyl-1,4-benzoquinol methylase